jgi:cytochrome c biogenesis protein CcmG/thiol:disulfide interchange protein DsbE
MPSLVQLQQKMGDKLTVLAVSLDEDEDAYKKFVDTRAKGLTTIRDGKQTSNALYGTYKFPESFVIDKDGKIQRKFIGAVDWTSPEIVDYFNKL